MHSFSTETRFPCNYHHFNRFRQFCYNNSIFIFKSNVLGWCKSVYLTSRILQCHRWILVESCSKSVSSHDFFSSMNNPFDFWFFLLSRMMQRVLPMVRLVAEISNLDPVANDFSDFLNFQTAKSDVKQSFHRR